jgi:hypothetical protein
MESSRKCLPSDEPLDLESTCRDEKGGRAQEILLWVMNA